MLTSEIGEWWYASESVARGKPLKLAQIEDVAQISLPHFTFQPPFGTRRIASAVQNDNSRRLVRLDRQNLERIFFFDAPRYCLPFALDYQRVWPFLGMVKEEINPSAFPVYVGP